MLKSAASEGVLLKSELLLPPFHGLVTACNDIFDAQVDTLLLPGSQADLLLLQQDNRICSIGPLFLLCSDPPTSFDLDEKEVVGAGIRNCADLDVLDSHRA